MLPPSGWTYTPARRELVGRTVEDEPSGLLEMEMGKLVSTFPDGRPTLIYVAKSKWESRRYLDVTLLDE